MGTFTNQVQGLVSEQKQARIEREEARQEKKQKELVKMELYNILNSFFVDDNVKNYKKIYLKLLETNKKWAIIGEITKKEVLEYYLDTNYTSILNKVAKPYLIQFQEIEKRQKELRKKRKEIIKANKQNRKSKEKEENKKEYSFFEMMLALVKMLLIIIAAPLIFGLMILYYLLRGK